MSDETPESLIPYDEIVQDALRGNGGALVYDSCNPYHRVWEMLNDPSTGARVEVAGA